MQTIFISGISSGIGKALALYYANKDCHVFGLSRRPLDYTHANITHTICDITHYESLDITLKMLISDDKVDMAILNAGVLGHMETMEEAKLDDLKATMEINLWAQKALLDSLIKQFKVKSYIAISSGAGIKGTMGWSGYSLSKAALNMLVQLYANEYPEYKFIAFAPGLVDTDMQEFISTCVDSKKFPTVKRLHEARGTDSMPTPDQFAIKFDEKLAQILEVESGDFVDLRNLV